MTSRKPLHLLVLVSMLSSLLLVGGLSPASARESNPPAAPANKPAAPAMPISPVDETKVPHYFGPYPNWANSPFTLPDVKVTIDPPGGTGRRATAQAVVGANGTVTGITITDPGSGYTSVPNVSITDAAGTNVTATATAVVTGSGAVTDIAVLAPGGGGYKTPVVSISGIGTGATATAYGGVEAVTVDPLGDGTGYTMPTVDFDFPDDPSGVIAKAHPVCVELNCVPVAPATTVTVVGVVVDDPGRGYAKAPNVVIREGTLYSPMNNRLADRAAALRSQIQSGEAPSAPAAPLLNLAATATLNMQYVVVNTFGSGYDATTTATIDDLATTNLASTAVTVDTGSVTQINLVSGGSGYVTTTGIKKFTDGLPGLCNPGAAVGSIPACPTTGKYIPLAVPLAKKYNGIEADEYEIGLVQYKTNFSSSLKDPVTGTPVGTLVRGYVQLESSEWLAAHLGVSQHVPLFNVYSDGSTTPVLVNGAQAYGVTPPQWLGPTIGATRDKPVRIIFRNLLPTGSGGDLFLPVDSSLMGSGMGPMAMTPPVDNGSVTDLVRNPMCDEYPKDTANCFADSRATLHLHGGTTPWISDGTAHQWITPADSNTATQPMWPQGVSVSPVPDMAGAGCDGDRDGCMTFYYTNQQSARLLFYHDHAWGITRLNVYAGEAAGYLISDSTEQALVASGAIPADQIPLVVQDRTFVPQDSQLYNVKDTGGNVVSYGQDPTWDKARWGGYGSFWYHHVYMPAQNPGDPSGMSAFGRWMYGPWFWPPAAGTVHGTIANPYYNMDPKATPPFSQPLAAPCNIDDPTTWQYQTDPFCEPALIPGTPNISVGMEQFNDTPIVNGVAYPTITLEPKAYRLRVLNAANDRFFNFQWYVADPNTASTGLNAAGQVIGGTEVALKAAELAAAQTDPNVVPTPDTTVSLPGPDWVQIGSEGGFLPAPVVVDGQQVTTWITDPTRFDVGNVDLHSLLLAPAERADVIVDFSAFAGQTLILYNDAPAAFPARVASYDYYTGAPDLSPVGAPKILPGYGPNTRTVMQVKIAGTVAPAFDLVKLQNAFKHHADGKGVFESGQHPIIVGQAAYNSAYGTSFAGSGDCSVPGSTQCDGYVRINDTATFGFNTLHAPAAKMTMPLEPKAIHDEMNSTTFDEFGRMQANLGVEAQPPTPGLQNVTLYPFVNPQTELIDATNLPKADITYDPATGLPTGDVKIKAISTATDGTQLWRITHNGVDTHPIHFHLYDVQVLNRVTWDNIIIPPDPTELGWKDTIRVSPLEDTIVALRPIIPELPFELPNAIRPLNPMMTLGSPDMFFNVDPAGNPTNPILNSLVNFGWEYVYHCHILSHEEMDMMRPVSVAMPPNQPDGLAYSISGTGNSATLTLTWNDNSINETSFLIQRMYTPGVWQDVGTVNTPLTFPDTNTHGTGSFTDTRANGFRLNTAYQYRVVALNTIGYGAEFPSMTARSQPSTPLLVGTAPAAPTNLTATLQAGALSAQNPGPQVRLAWTNNATNAALNAIERCQGAACTNFTQIATVAANATSYVDNAVGTPNGDTFKYQVRAVNAVGNSPYAGPVSRAVPALPPAPTGVTAAVRLPLPAGNSRTVDVTWTIGTPGTGQPVATSFTIQRATTPPTDPATVWATAGTVNSGTATSFADTGAKRGTTYYYRVVANYTSTVRISNPSAAFGPLSVQ